jgi:hypothetical protein
MKMMMFYYDIIQMVPMFQGILHCHSSVYFRNGTKRLLQNVGIQLQNSTVSHTRLPAPNIITHNFISISERISWEI